MNTAQPAIYLATVHGERIVNKQAAPVDQTNAQRAEVLTGATSAEIPVKEKTKTMLYEESIQRTIDRNKVMWAKMFDGTFPTTPIDQERLMSRAYHTARLQVRLDKMSVFDNVFGLGSGGKAVVAPNVRRAEHALKMLSDAFGIKIAIEACMLLHTIGVSQRPQQPVALTASANA